MTRFDVETPPNDFEEPEDTDAAQEAARLKSRAYYLAQYALRKATHGKAGVPVPARTFWLNPFPVDLPEDVFAVAGSVLDGWGYDMDHQRRYRTVIPGLPFKIPRHTITVQAHDFSELPPTPPLNA